MRKRLLLLVSSLLITGCSDLGDPAQPGGNGENSGDEPVSFSGDLRSILDSRCINCHMAGNASGGLILTEGDSPANLVDVESNGYAPDRLVEAGVKERSVIYLKLMGNADYGSRMPLGGSLDVNQLALFGRWIDEGAPDN